MWSLPACSPRHGILVAVAILAIAPSAPARQTDSWTGTSTATPSNLWTDATNWSTGVPVSGNTATFNGAGNGNTSISLGGAAQPISTISFTGSPAAYTLGVLSSGDAFSISAGGSITVAAGINTTQTIDAALMPAGTMTVTNNGTGLLALAGNIALAGTTSLSTGASATGGTLTVSGLITGSSQITVLGVNTFELTNPNNTYSGNTQLNGNGTILPITVSSNGLPGPSFTAGPFGTGTITVNSGTNQHFRPIGTQMISNSILLSTGMAMDTTPGDTTSSLTFAGPIVSNGTGRFISNGFAAGTSEGGTMILGSAAAPSTLTLPTASGQTVSIVAVWGPVVINDVIQNSGSVVGNINLNNQAPDINPILMSGASTYTGTTTIGANTANMGPIGIGISSNGVLPGSFSFGPFGLSTVIMNNTVTAPVLAPYGADRSVGNAITMTSNFSVASATAALDPTGPHNLALTGPITLGATGRTLTNTLATGVALTLGSVASPSTISLGSTLTLAGGGTTIINDAISGTGGLTVQGGSVQLTNGSNSYGGATSVTGGTLLVNNTIGSGTGANPVSVTGAGTLGSGGILGGTGSIAGTASVSSTTSTIQGGIVYPGNGGANAGTLTVGTMQWNPYGRYVFAYNPTNTTTGGGVNSLISGSGGATLDLSNLSSTTPFDLNLLPLSMFGTGSQQTYVIADFTGGITGTVMGTPTQPIANGTDISSLFTLSGTYTSAPALFATVVAGPGGGTDQAIDLTFTTPAPASSFTWTGAVSGSWMNASNWNPASVPTGSANLQLTFGTTGNAAMTNDIAGTLTLNSMTFNAGAPVYTLSGNGLNFVTNSSDMLPIIVSNSSNSVTLSVPLTLTNGLTVSGSGNVTLGGAISGAGAVTMSGTGTLILSSTSNTYTGGTNVLSGTLQVPSDSSLGSGNVTGATLGTLSFTGSTATTKSFAMNGGTIAVAAGQTVTFNGNQITSATLDGNGTFATNGVVFDNGTTTSSVAITSTSASDRFIHVVNNAALTFAGGLNPSVSTAVANLNGFTNEGSGSVTIGAGSAINAANFQSYGTLTLVPNTTSAPTVFTNTGTATLGFNGGSRTFIGTPGTADPTGQNIVAYVDLHGHNAVVADGLFVNNGGIFDTVGAGSSTIIADFGSLVKAPAFIRTPSRPKTAASSRPATAPARPPSATSCSARAACPITSLPSTTPPALPVPAPAHRAW